MRKPFFRALYFEELEARVLANMPFGHLGAPILGSPSLISTMLVRMSLRSLHSMAPRKAGTKACPTVGLPLIMPTRSLMFRGLCLFRPRNQEALQ